jgi:hypothetical protein
MEGAMQSEIKTLIHKYGELRQSVKDLIHHNERLIEIMKTQEV